MRKVFVTGGAGFIGSNFVRYWLSEYPDDLVINYDLLTYAGNLENLADVAEMHADRYVFVKGDINNYGLTLHLFKHYKPDYIVNFAAESHNSRAVLHPEIFYQTNVMGTQSLLQAAKEALNQGQISRIACIDCNSCNVRCAMGFDVRGRALSLSKIQDVPESFLV